METLGKRIFRLQFSEEHESRCYCGHCKQLGLISPFSKVFEDYKRSIDKLNYDLIDRVLVPCFAKKTKNYQYIKETIGVQKIKHIEGEDGLHIVSDLRDLDCSRENLIIVTQKLIKDKNIVKILSLFKGKNFFYAPRKIHFRDGLATLRQLYKFTLKMNKNNIVIGCYPGLTLWEDRAPVDLCFEPFSKNKVKNVTPKKISIIIPVFEQKKYLLRTLQEISKQDYPLENVEVIIIDDGGSDELEKDIAKVRGIPHLHYEYFSREIKRIMGDFRFRAGIARNLGYRVSKGEILFFLDADVLLPRDALKCIENELDDCDLLQIQRYDLNEKSTRCEKPIDKVNEKDLIFEGRSYWYNFFEKAKVDWNQMSDAWKYVCTYGLIIRRSDFRAMGGFNNNYIGYGFEDTDLGLRMKKRGGHFKLSRVISYHQFHANERSEFKNGQFSRKKVLSRTAKTFFLNHLDPDIYRCLKDYM